MEKAIIVAARNFCLYVNKSKPSQSQFETQLLTFGLKNKIRPDVHFEIVKCLIVQYLEGNKRDYWMYLFYLWEYHHHTLEIIEEVQKKIPGEVEQQIISGIKVLMEYEMFSKTNKKLALS